MQEAADLELLVMTLLDSAKDPVGSGAVCDWLRQNRVQMSEATVGRYLRSLDIQGMTERDGFRGRTLTQHGQERLAELRVKRLTALTSSELIQSLRPKDISDTIEVLVARRALEREIARLAATKASDEDVEVMEVLLSRYDAAVTPTAAAEADFAFHERLADVAGNRVLQAATRLIHAEAKVVPIPDHMRGRLKPTLSRQHKEILEALRNRNPERAETAMMVHLDFLIENVYQFGSQYHS